MKRVIRLLRAKRKILEEEVQFDELMIKKNAGSLSVQKVRRISVVENKAFLEEIKMTLELIDE